MCTLGELLGYIIVVMGAPNDALLTLEEVRDEYGMGRAALDARSIPRARVGRSYKWRRSDIEAAIEAQPVSPRPRKSRQVTAENVDPLDQMLARGELRRVATR
jgi:predicted DNA-binding transcriptional regulator AlpA